MTTLLELPGFTLREAAKHLGIHEKTIYRWVHEGRLQAEIDNCNQYRIPYGELYSALKAQEDLSMN